MFENSRADGGRGVVCNDASEEWRNNKVFSVLTSVVFSGLLSAASSGWSGCEREFELKKCALTEERRRWPELAMACIDDLRGEIDALRRGEVGDLRRGEADGLRGDDVRLESLSFRVNASSCFSSTKKKKKK